MSPVVIFSLVGILIGAFALGYHGWAIGGLFGFLLGQVLRLSNKLESQERVLKSLQKQIQQPASVSTAPASTPVVDETIKTSSGIPNVSPPQAISISATTAAPETVSLELDLPSEDSKPISVTQDPPAATPPNNENPWQPQSTPTSEPDIFEKLFARVFNFFTQGNPIVRIGMVVMFFGLSFLVKYASNQGLFPLELRMAVVAAIAIALVILGWKTRIKEDGYGLVLQGGGIAALYLTVFAAAKMYSLMPTGAAFGLMFFIVLLGAALAVLQNAQVLALMATAGGFLAPILTSDGSGNHVGLFSFYLILNLGILAIAWFKTWRMLNWVGFVFTFVITSAWGVLKYQPHLYASTQPFLLAFFALYLVVSILFSLKQPPNLKGLVDGSLVFGLPIVGFGLQTALLKHTEYGLAISALVLAFIYILLARWLWGRYQQTHRLLIESFIALGVCFATLSIPLALDAQWTSATWALEAAGLIWVGLRQQRLLPRFAGYALHLAAAFSIVIKGIDTGATPIVSGSFIGLIILSLSALGISWLMYKHNGNLKNAEKPLAAGALLVGWIWWLFAGFYELGGHVPADRLFNIVIIFFALSCVATLVISRWINWSQLLRTGFWLLPLVGFWSIRNFGEALFIGYDLHPSQSWGWLAFLVFAVIQYCFLWLQRERESQTLISVYHVLTAWFIISLVFWEASWWQGHYDWHGTAAAMLWFAVVVIPLVALLMLTKKPIWPFAQYEGDYKNLIPAPLMMLLCGWFVVACTYSGATSQIYLPVLNPLDLAQLAILLLTAYSIKRNFVYLGSISPEARYGLLGVLGFAWINIVLLRAIHHYTGVAYDADILWDSVVVQMALSILWSICALLVMNFSRRLQERKLWILGAVILGFVVLKLFTKDLSGTGTLARIVSFMVVGGLMLLIGYLSPIPAKTKSIQEESV